jgi:nucleotide-binding universal stress UspA family protein
MNATKIIVPTDFSSASEEALRWATSLARDSGATLLIVHVEEPPMAYAGELPLVPDEETRDELRRSLLGTLPPDASVAYEHKLLVGDPATAIVVVAEDEHADLIVMGSHGRKGITRLLMGSVAEAVVRRAKCPVLTVKQPAEVGAAL